MAVMFLYDRYVKLFGVRRLGELENPRVRPISRFCLPRGANVHYMPMNEFELGPSSTDPIVMAAQRLIYIDHVSDLLSKEGNPRPTYKLLPPMAQQYRREHMNIRPMRDYNAAAKDPLTLAIINYAMVAKMYRYQRSALMKWWNWKNMRATQWLKFNQMKTEFPRHHMILVDVPDKLPALSDLRKAERNMTPMLMKVFNTRERLDLLDIFIWLGENRQRSPLSNVDPARYDEIILVIRRDTGFININLGLLNSWRKETAGVSMESFVDASSDMPPEFDFESTYNRYVSMEELGDDTLDEDMMFPSMEAPQGLDPKIMQIRFLKFLTKIIDKTSSVTAPETVDEKEEAAQSDKDDLEQDAKDDAERMQVDDDVTQEAPKGDVSADVLLAEEEEELSADLDDPAVPDDATEMTDEDGELIIETSDKPVVEVSQISADGAETHTLTSSIQSKIDELADKELLTGAQYRRMQRAAEAYKTLPDPYKTGNTIEQSIAIPEETLVLEDTDLYPEMDGVRDTSMLQSTVEKMDSQYIEKVLKADILNAVMSVQKAGVAVTGYNIETVKDAVSHYEIHKVTLTPVTGKPSTITFRVPVLDKRGTYVSNGQRYRHRTQKGDVPIRKVSPSRVALTSYYSKLFVDRSQRAVFNYDAWICKQLISRGMDIENSTISDLKIANVADTSLKLPNIYTILSGRILSFKSGTDQFWFDYAGRERAKIFDMAEVATIEAVNTDMVVIGRRGKDYLVVDVESNFWKCSGKGEGLVELGPIEQLLGLSAEKAPPQVAEISIFGKTLPIGVALAYLVGLDKLLANSGARYRSVPVGTRLQLQDDEYAIKFLDETLILEKSDVKNSLLFAGFLQYHKQIRQYSRHSFNKRDVYFNVLEANGVGLRYLRELDLMNAMWVDPITKDVLGWMNEPTEFMPLLHRAVELLVTRYVPVEVEGANGLVSGLERAKGYERIPGAIYSELVRSIRVYNARSASATSSITMKPHEIWVNIVQDPAAAIVDDINPIQNLKQKEIITYGGRGGRSSRSMTAEARLYKETDIGFISEATVDSGDVAVITSMSPNANIKSVRGTVGSFDRDGGGAASMVSTSALLSPFADRDDPKRVGFISIQQSHVISAKGYRESPISTGYDHIIAHRTDEIFSIPATKSGEVIERSADHLVIANDDGTFEHIDLTVQYGISAGSVYPQEQASTFQLGDKVSPGDIIKYNPGFFKPCKFDKRQVQWMAGVLARTTFMEASYTLEDSSAIDDWLSNQMQSEVTKVKSIVVRFDQQIRNLVKEGDHTDISSILCTIEDAATAEAGLFSDDDLETLRMMGSATPLAGAVGTVTKIEVFYHGDQDDLSDSLLELVSAQDKRRRKYAKLLNREVVSGQVDQSLRIDGDGLDLDHLVIKVYITHQEGMGVGDKAIFANQMKTVVGHRLSGKNQTRSGAKINAIFGAKSVMDRIVSSALLIGMSISVQVAIGESASAMWLSDE